MVTVPTPTWKFEWNLNTLVSLIGFIGIFFAWGATWNQVQSEMRANSRGDRAARQAAHRGRDRTANAGHSGNPDCHRREAGERGCPIDALAGKHAEHSGFRYPGGAGNPAEDRR